MKITANFHQINGALKALQELDRTDDKGKRLYKFDNVMFRLGIAAKLRKLADIGKAVDDERLALAREHQVTGDDNKVDRERQIAFTDKVNELFEAKHELDLSQIDIAQMQLDKNEIPSWALAELAWMLTGDLEPAAKDAENK